MGRPRKPTAQKVMKGTAQACRLNPGEPEPERGIPDPPEHLSERARSAWPGVAQLLDGMGVLTIADSLVLEGLCETYAELVEARLALRARRAMSYCTEPSAEESVDEKSPLDELVEQAIAAAEKDMADAGEEPPEAAPKRRRGKIMWRMYPEVAMINELDRRFAMWLAKVGLTPADRSRVNASAQGQAADGWDEL
jgi:P27 family predicted phage terminase small subunit